MILDNMLCSDACFLQLEAAVNLANKTMMDLRDKYKTFFGEPLMTIFSTV